MKYRLIIDRDAEEEIVATVHSPSELTAKIENLVKSYTGDNRIVVCNGDGVMRLEFADIECIIIDDRKVYALDIKGERHRINGTLSDIEEALPSYFIRINKSAIANENRIKQFNTVYSGAVDAIFKCGYREYVSRRCFREIKRRLNVK